MRKAILALLLSCSTLFATDPPKLKPQIDGNEGALVTVVAETPEAVVKFLVISGDGLVVIPSDKLVDKKTLIAVGKPGRYRVIAWTAGKDGPSDAAETLVVIKGKDDNVNPPDVEPSDPVYKKLREAYTNESAVNKKVQIVKLATAYRDTAKSIAKGDPITAGDVFRTAQSFRTAAIGGDLTLVREVAGDSVSVLLGDEVDQKIKDRAAITALFNSLASYCERIGK